MRSRWIVKVAQCYRKGLDDGHSTWESIPDVQNSIEFDLNVAASNAYNTVCASFDPTFIFNVDLGWQGYLDNCRRCESVLRPHGERKVNITLID